MHESHLEAAYRSASYAVTVPGREPVVIHCGVRCPPLDILLAESRATTWAFITACNPRSTRLDDDANSERMLRLETAVRSRGLACLPGEGLADDGSWPPERSLLVLGIGEKDAVALARQFEQHAILVGTRGGEPRLVWTSRRLERPDDAEPSAGGEPPPDGRTWRELAVTDPLTGLPNRRRLDELVRAEWSRWTGAAAAITVMLADIDRFKAVNDTRGHAAGDACLVDVAAALAASMGRAEGLVCRWGGEEFLALMPGVDDVAAAGIARRAAAAVRGLSVQHPDSPVGVVTVSIGTATRAPAGSGGFADLVARADRALHAAKEAGRNRIVAAAD